VIYNVVKQTTASFGFSADHDGRYEYCFSNQMSSVTSKLVSFTLQGPDEASKFMEKTAKGSTEASTEPLDVEVRQLVDGIRGIRDEQMYMRERERVHRMSKQEEEARCGVVVCLVS
jgi:p24 family protein beta-1